MWVNWTWCFRPLKNSKAAAGRSSVLPRGTKCSWKALTFALTNVTGGKRGKRVYHSGDFLCTQVFALKMGYPYTWNGIADLGPAPSLSLPWEGWGRETGEKLAASLLTPLQLKQWSLSLAWGHRPGARRKQWVWWSRGSRRAAGSRA